MTLLLISLYASFIWIVEINNKSEPFSINEIVRIWLVW